MTAAVSGFKYLTKWQFVNFTPPINFYLRPGIRKRNKQKLLRHPNLLEIIQKWTKNLFGLNPVGELLFGNKILIFKIIDSDRKSGSKGFWTFLPYCLLFLRDEDNCYKIGYPRPLFCHFSTNVQLKQQKTWTQSAPANMGLFRHGTLKEQMTRNPIGSYCEKTWLNGSYCKQWMQWFLIKAFPDTICCQKD